MLRETNSGAAPAAGAIVIQGAREHNLKNLTLVLPRGRFVVVTGVSGSGKSTLAFDLLFAEGQRRFLDSMNAYARQFVEQLARPDVDRITGLPPTVSIEQRTSRGGGKSTVATVTEIHPFLRLLFARLGTQFCPDCQRPVEAQTRDALAAGLKRELRQRGDLLLLAPVVRNRKGFHSEVAEWAAKRGYTEIRADGKVQDTSQPLRLDRFREHDLEIVVGTVTASRPSAAGSTQATPPRAHQTRLRELVDDALELGHGTLFALDHRSTLTVHSTERACPRCGRSFPPLDPKNFSYNSSQGWCPRCRGFGELFYLPEAERGANADRIEETWWSWANERELCPECHGARLNPLARAVHLPGVPPLDGRGDFAAAHQPPEGATPNAPTLVDFGNLTVEFAFELFRRLRFTGRAGLIARDILPGIRERLKFLRAVGLGYLQLGRAVPTLSGGESQRIRLAAQLGSNLSGVLYVLDEPTIGLHPRDNERLLAALERLRARGNSVVVVEHDEQTMRRADWIVDLGPGAGLHGGQVVAAGPLAELRRHPESVTGRCLRAKKQFPTRGKRRPVQYPISDIRYPKQTRTPKAEKPADAAGPRVPSCGMAPGPEARVSNLHWLTLHNAAVHNLKDLTARFPLNRLVLVTGVSGSGKSTLIRECLLPALQAALKSPSPPHATRSEDGDKSRERGRTPLVSGHESLKAVYEVDQTPIGRTPRSVPATYVGFFDDIRALFAQTPAARMRGYTASRFSFNSPQGRCPECEGAGQVKLEMNFLPPAFVRCETCQGTRFNPETLDLEYRGKNIAQVLQLTVEEAIEFFAPIPKIKRPLQALHDTGLDYLKLGQTSPTLSGGEAQRVKLVTHLLTGLKDARALALTRPDGHPLPSQGAEGTKPCPLLVPHRPGRRGEERPEGRAPKRNLFILEEPTIGLHAADVRLLVDVLQQLVDAGHSVIVIEHNLDLIAEADWILDLGPDGGDGGGRIVCQGTPEQVAANKHSHTGHFLSKLLRGT